MYVIDRKFNPFVLFTTVGISSSNEALVSTAETIPFAEDHDDVDVCSIPSTITITDENDDCDLQRHNANKKTWRNVIELRNHKRVRLTKFCDVNQLKDI